MGEANKKKSHKNNTDLSSSVQYMCKNIVVIARESGVTLQKGLPFKFQWKLLFYLQQDFDFAFVLK